MEAAQPRSAARNSYIKVVVTGRIQQSRILLHVFWQQEDGYNHAKTLLTLRLFLTFQTPSSISNH